MGPLRFLLAVAVIAFHSGLHVLGPLAVYSFFIMSGYAIFAGLDESKLNGSRIVKFFRRRLGKLLPDYFLACLAITLILVFAETLRKHSSQDLVANSAPFASRNVWQILDLWIPKLDFSLTSLRLNPSVTLVPPWWSVVFELGFYTICAMVIYVYKGSKRFLLIYFSFALAIHIFLLFATGQDLSKLNMLVYFNFFGTLVFFALGNLSRHSSKAYKRNPRISRIAFASLLVFLFFFGYVFEDPTQIVPGHPVWGYLGAVYLVAFLTVLFLLNLPQERITTKGEVFFSTHSYGIYVWQSAVFLIIGLAEKANRLPVTTGFQRFSLVLLLTIICTLLSSQTIKLASHLIRNFTNTCRRLKNFEVPQRK